MKKKVDHRKQTLLRGIAVLLTACLLLLAFRIYAVLDAERGRVDTSKDDSYAYTHDGRPEYLVGGQWYVQRENVETYLLIGIDKYEAAIRDADSYRNDQQADALFLLAVDRKNASYGVIHINRDAMANIRMLDLNCDPYGTFVGQLALSHTYGTGREDSGENTVWSVSDTLYGLQIDHFLSVSMDAVGIINDKLGGVTLTVSDDMTMIDAALEKGRTVTLQGAQALAYVRSRGGLADSTNLSRMERQRQYIEAFLEQARKAVSADGSLAADILLTISDYLVTDLDSEGLLNLTEALNNYDFNGIRAIEGEAHKGEEYIEFYPDEAALKQIILDVFYQKK